MCLSVTVCYRVTFVQLRIDFDNFGDQHQQQLTTYLTDNGLLPDLQSAYRAHHSTETAVLKVVGDILLALDSGNLALLSLLDLSAAFDTVDHDTLLRRLQTSYGLDGVVIKWFASYLSGRTNEFPDSGVGSNLQVGGGQNAGAKRRPKIF